MNCQRLHDKGFRPEKAEGSSRLCRCCRGDFRPYRSTQIFCSSKCRRIFWSGHTFAEAVKAGRAEGMIDLVRELVGASEI